MRVRTRTLVALLLVSGCANTRPAAERPRVVIDAETLSGEPVSIGGPGPIRVVDLWATWCEPCRISSDRVATFLRRHPDVEEIALSVDDDVAAVGRFLEKQPVPGRVLHFPGGMRAASQQGLRNIPLFIVLDVEGGVVATITGLSSDLERRLAAAVLDGAAGPGAR